MDVSEAEAERWFRDFPINQWTGDGASNRIHNGGEDPNEKPG